MIFFFKRILFWQPADFAANPFLFFFSHWFSWLIIFGLSGWWILKKNYREVAFFWFLLVLSVFFEFFIKHFSPWMRPFIASGVAHPNWIGGYSGGSFPSGHAARSVIILFYAWRMDRRLFWILLPGMALVNAGRVLFALHYPIDIIGGLLLGLAMIWGLKKISTVFGFKL